jgi:predicted Zn-dependent protease
MCFAARFKLVERGEVQRSIIPCEIVYGKPGVANQRAQDWFRAPIDRMANLNMEPGQDRFEDIIASIGKGVFMEANRSWSIDDYRNKFQFGCEYARLIEDGRLTKTVRNPNYRGISATFWRNLFKVGDASTFGVFGTPNCGNDNDSGRITGMTRFACFWVEDGQIAAPIKDMRFDESIYHLFGDKLKGLTRQRSLIPDTGSYFQRALGGALLPGILVDGFTFTL